MSEAIVSERSYALRAALRLEIITVLWMAIEAAVAIGEGIIARSLLLIAFGIDSGIELASAIVVFRRFRPESHRKFFSEQPALPSARFQPFLACRTKLLISGSTQSWSRL